MFSFLRADGTKQNSVLKNELAKLYLEMDALLQMHPIQSPALQSLVEKIHNCESKLKNLLKSEQIDFSEIFDRSTGVPSTVKSKLTQTTTTSFSAYQWRRRFLMSGLDAQALLSFFHRENIVSPSTNFFKSPAPRDALDFSDNSEKRIDKSEIVRFSLRPGHEPSGTVFRRGLDDKEDSWMSIFTHQFKKNMAILDKKLQGRAMEAILEISDDPLQTRGDTVKKLSGALAGMWRYRIGDYRLIYEPMPKFSKIFFIDIGSRGGVYGLE
jgi:mRNA interferase RelE/StbE